MTVRALSAHDALITPSKGVHAMTAYVNGLTYDIPDVWVAEFRSTHEGAHTDDAVMSWHREQSSTPVGGES